MILVKKIKQFFIKRRIKKTNYVNFGKNTSVNLNCTFGGYNSIGSNSIFLNSRIGVASYISSNCKLNKAKIGKFCSIGQNVRNGIGRHPSTVFVSTHPAFFSTKKQAGFTFTNTDVFKEHLYIDSDENYFIEICNDVWIGNDVTIFDGVRIGDGAVIANGAIVTKDVEPYAIVGGVPSKLIKMRFNHSQIKFLIEYKWWNKDIAWIKKNYKYFHNINDLVSLAYDDQ